MEDYISNSRMREDTIWATENEIMAFCQLFQTTVYVWNTTLPPEAGPTRWLTYRPRIRRSDNLPSIFIFAPVNHYEICLTTRRNGRLINDPNVFIFDPEVYRYDYLRRRPFVEAPKKNMPIMDKQISTRTKRTSIQASFPTKQMYVDYIREKKKTIEGRLGYDYVKKLKSGHIVEFSYGTLPSTKVLCKVKSISKEYASFREMLKVSFKNINALLKRII